MTRCCVAKLLVQTQLCAFPPIIAVPSHLSRFNNFGCTACIQRAFWEQNGSLTVTTSILPTCKSEGEKGKKGEMKKKVFTFIIIVIIITVFLLRKWERLLIICKCLGEGLVPVFYCRFLFPEFLLNLFVLSSCRCIILSRMFCLHQEELFFFTLPENCISENKGRSYSSKNSSQTCQNACFLIHFK